MPEKEAARGKRENQKIKPYVVLQYLVKETDEDHLKTASEIIAFLEVDCGIEAERRSIYKDIDAINEVALMLQNGCTIDEAKAELEANKEDTSIRLVVYDKKRKGFYVSSAFRQYDFNDIRLLAECVYSSKYIAEGQAKRLVDHVIGDFVSIHQAEKIRHDAFLTDRVKTNNRHVFNNISKITEAMSTRIEGKPHVPEKIKFSYMKYSIDSLNEQVERRPGKPNVISPFHLIIDNGNYYLLAFNRDEQKIWTYRVDRMKDVRLTGEPREGDDEFKKIDIRTFAQRTISMYSGEQVQVSVRSIMSLLDTFIEQFGTKDVMYRALDDHHFKMTATVDVSQQFFAWLLRFGKRVQILSPDTVKQQFIDYLDMVKAVYSTVPTDKSVDKTAAQTIEKPADK
ncbi:MAG: WYL domain-containing protein [Clostridiales bacterium]|nr:WYL domain-containing protein [Clostridiales bacterium]